MTKTEFLNSLRSALVGRVSQETIDETINYYNGYIDSQAAEEGEEQVLASLGDPRLIARSIVDAQSGEGQRSQGGTAYPDTEGETAVRNLTSKVPPIVWAGLALAGLIAVAAIALKVLFAFGPVIAIIVVIAILYKRLGGK